MNEMNKWIWFNKVNHLEIPVFWTEWGLLGLRSLRKEMTYSLPVVTHFAKVAKNIYTIYKILPKSVFWGASLKARWLWNSLCGHWPPAVQASAVFRCTSPRAIALIHSSCACVRVCVSGSLRLWFAAEHAGLRPLELWLNIVNQSQSTSLKQRALLSQALCIVCPNRQLVADFTLTFHCQHSSLQTDFARWISQHPRCYTTLCPSLFFGTLRTHR